MAESPSVSIAQILCPVCPGGPMRLANQLREIRIYICYTCGASLSSERPTANQGGFTAVSSTNGFGMLARGLSSRRSNGRSE